MNTLKFKIMNLSILKKLFLSFSIAVILPVIALTYLVVNISSSIIIQKDIDGSLKEMSTISDGLESLNGYVDDILKIVISNTTLQQYTYSSIPKGIKKFEQEAYASSILDAIINSDNSIDSICIYGYNGFNFGSSSLNTSKMKIYNQNTDPLYKQLLSNWGAPIVIDNEAIYHKDNVNSKATNSLAIAFTRPILNTDTGEITGRAVLNLNINSIIKLLPKYNENTIRFFIANSKGELIASGTKNTDELSIKDSKYYSYITSVSQGAHEFTINNTKFLVTSKQYMPLNWIIVSIKPQQYVLQDNIKATRMILVIGLICTIFACIVSLLLAKSISRPVVELSKLMQNAGQGDLEVYATVESNDEIGMLSKDFNNMLNKISTLIMQVSDEQRKAKTSELMALQAQINPHFLYNTLESICSLITMHRNIDAYNMVRSLSIFYRTSLSNGRDIITLKEEIDNISNYLLIQKIRYGDKLSYSINIPDDLFNCRIPKLTLQPLVENSIYHGIRNKHGGGVITLLGHSEDSKLILSVFDNGIGIEEDNIKTILQPKGNIPNFGLCSVNERIKLCFGVEYGISITSHINEWTEVSIILPKEQRI